MAFNPAKSITRFSLDHPLIVTFAMVGITAVLIALAAVPSVLQRDVGPLPPAQIDTDPENMLPHDEPHRVFHDRMKAQFTLWDMVVVGVVNETHPQGVFNPDTLARVYELTEFAKTLSWPDPDHPNDPTKRQGVVEADLIAPSAVDNVHQDDQGVIQFSWLMRQPPTTEAEALAVRDAAQDIPFLNGTLVSEDGKAVAVYLPLTRKDISYQVREQLLRAEPSLWLWAEVNRKLNDAAMPDDARRHVVTLGRYIAQQAADLDATKQGLTSLADQIGRAGITGLAVTRKEGEKLPQRITDVIDSLNAMMAADDAWIGDASQTLREASGAFDLASVDDQVHITGLPVAEDTFGVEMFYQMAISAPLAMGVIFLLMWWFFKKLALIVPPMIVAMVCALGTMALLIISGNTIHIMSSMIPIFIMPIAVLDAIHIISDFFDRYGETRDRRKTMLEVMDTLFMPMLFTTLTTTAGFASLALTPIPPVQVFGIFVGVGVLLAWWWTITFIPAAVMLIPERWLASLAGSDSSPLEGRGRVRGESHEVGDGQAGQDDDVVEGPTLTPALSLKGRGGVMASILAAVGRATHRYAIAILVGTVVIGGVAAYGISRININDNPTKWFTSSHPIRVADRVLNDHFGGTYMAYLHLAPEGEVGAMAPHGGQDAGASPAETPDDGNGDGGPPALPSGIGGGEDAGGGGALPSLPSGLGGEPVAEEDQPQTPTVEAKPEVFKQPEVLRYIAGLQEYLLTIKGEDGHPLVGKSNSQADLVKTVHRELYSGEGKDYRVPDTAGKVAETLFQYQNSHRPQDLWHFVTPDYRQANLWLQLRSGDNRDMSHVVAAIDRYIADNPPPANLQHKWFGLTYINVIWQEEMVSGMLNAFLGSFLVVLLLMILLFRSGLWGLLSMIPLTVTVGLIYGLIGLIGKDYDMPVAVLSSLSLGLAIDYAIHFLARSRYAYEKHGSWDKAVGPMFGEPARAITRNAIVVGVGFLPLLAAPLMPYKTVGIFIALILITAGVASILILPAMITVLEKWLFPATKGKAVTCRCGTCALTGVAAVGVVAINIHQFIHVGYTTLTWVSLAAIAVLLGLCWLNSRRAACRTPQSESDSTPQVEGASS